MYYINITIFYVMLASSIVLLYRVGLGKSSADVLLI